ncbi:MAG: Crp/Fnr family transcriptional regulator [Candidatus Marinimicrobia bacterium]|jgi:CRP-like cAMP-binding protein|nr:Crp/Fnr family transcriptional regulator [Candidatus Neomarinimicrobiota bacterium]MDD4960622.1 Crp/Fnr family transcriptional regulator [Candidatus Neomarinimicrobiota bacterium]MDD5709596.1 Crp/Fnr family transcriptional regulator [Candidatus Neomarinimicrobiota bacterium]MDX9777456.1 Crp/Fnr family transcriptional regulator [bacterium]
MNIYEKLLQNPLFRGLEMPVLRHLLEEVSYQRKNYPPEAFIARGGEESAGIHLLLSGSVRAEMNSLSGKVLNIEDIEGKRILAPAFVFGRNNRYPVDIIANRETECLFLTRHVFLRLLRMNEMLLKNYLDLISDRAQFLSEKLRFLSLYKIRSKIAHYLLELNRGNGQYSFRLPLSHSRLAELFGVARPSFTRSLHELEKRDLIRIEGKSISILNRRGLEKLLE